MNPQKCPIWLNPWEPLVGSNVGTKFPEALSFLGLPLLIWVKGLEWKVETRLKVPTPTDDTLHTAGKNASRVPSPCSLASYIPQHTASITPREIHLHFWKLLHSNLQIWEKIYHIPTLMNCMDCRELSSDPELCRSSDSARQCAWWPYPSRAQWCHLLLLLRNEVSRTWAMEFQFLSMNSNVRKLMSAPLSKILGPQLPSETMSHSFWPDLLIGGLMMPRLPVPRASFT